MGLFSVASYSMFGFLFAVLASAPENSTTDIIQEEQCQDSTHVNSGVSSSNLSTYSRNFIQEEQCQDTTHVYSGVSSSNASTAAKDCQLSIPEGLFDKINILPDLIKGLISVGNSLLEDPSPSPLEHSQNRAMAFDHHTTPDNLFSSMDRHTSSSPTGRGETKLLIKTEYRNLLSTNCPATLKLAETEEPHIPNEATSEEPKYRAIGRAHVQIPSTGSSSILHKQKHVAEVDDCRRRSTGETGSDCSTQPSVYAMAKRKCIHCGTEDTPLWRKGPDGQQTLCNACGIHYKAAGKLLPEYRPAGSPSFDRSKHSNYYRKIMTKKAGSPP